MICTPIIAGERGSDNAKKLEKGLRQVLDDARGCAPTAPMSGRSAPRPGLLSCEKKVGKDSPGTSWSLDPQHKGADPLGFPRSLP